MQDLIHRMNQTAHISLQIPAISKSVETKSTSSALTYRRDLPLLPQVFSTSRPSEAPPRQTVQLPQHRLSAAGEGVFTANNQTLQPLFRTSFDSFLRGLNSGGIRPHLPPDRPRISPAQIGRQGPDPGRSPAKQAIFIDMPPSMA